MANQYDRLLSELMDRTGLEANVYEHFRQFSEFSVVEKKLRSKIKKFPQIDSTLFNVPALNEQKKQEHDDKKGVRPKPEEIHVNIAKPSAQDRKKDRSSHVIGKIAPKHKKQTRRHIKKKPPAVSNKNQELTTQETVEDEKTIPSTDSVTTLPTDDGVKEKNVVTVAIKQIAQPTKPTQSTKPSNIPQPAHCSYSLYAKQASQETESLKKNILNLKEEHQMTLKAVFDDQCKTWPLRALVNLVRALGGEIKATASNRCRIEIKNIYAHLLMPSEDLLPLSSQLSQKATVTWHGSAKQKKNKRGAPAYLIAQFRAALERVGYTPKTLGLDQKTDHAKLSF